MARTAPTYTGTPTYVIVSFKFIDANGALATTPYITTLARATVSNIEALADALAEASNANLYDIVLETHNAGAASAASAVEESRESANDVITTLVRDPVTRQTQEVVIPAPLDALLVAGTNTVDAANGLYQAVNTAANTVLPDAYTFVSTRFSEHRKINQKTKF
jgi:hypothetical protein